MALLLSLALLAQAPAPAAYPLRCHYFSARDLEIVDRCAAPVPGGFVLAPAVVADLAYTHGLATLTIPGRGWFYRRRGGRMVEMVTFDNGPDGFSQGLARAVIGGKLAYVDRRLNVRIRTAYDWGEPFSDGRAAVCTGCVAQADGSGEHSVMTGGTWRVIDRRGRVVAQPAAGRP